MRQTHTWTRWGGVAAIAGAIWCAILAVIHSSIENAALRSVQDTSRPLFDAALRFHEFVEPTLGLTPYYLYGRMFFPVYLAALAGAWALHSAQANGRMERIGFRLLAGSLIVATVGDVLAYWGGNDPKEFAPIQEAGFGFELLSLVTMTVGILIWGLAARKSEVLPRWAGWLMILAAPASVIVSTLVIGYVPHGWVLPISVSLGIAGTLVLRPKGNGRTLPSLLGRRLR